MATKTVRIKNVKMPAMDVKSGKWLGQDKSVSGVESEARPDQEQDMGDLLTQGDLKGRTFVMSPSHLFKIWTKGTGDSDATKMRIDSVRRAKALQGKEDTLFRWKFSPDGELDDVINPETGESVLPKQATEEGFLDIEDKSGKPLPSGAPANLKVAKDDPDAKFLKGIEKKRKDVGMSSIDVAGDEPGFACGGAVKSSKFKVTGKMAGGPTEKMQMTGGEIQEKFGVSKPGDPTTIYNCEIRDGKLVNAEPDKSASMSNSRDVSEPVMKTASSGAGFAEGGPVEAEAVPSEPMVAGPEVEAPVASDAVEAAPVEAPKVEESMKGPFEAYAKVAGIDTQLVTKGDTLFNQLSETLSSGDPEAAQAQIDQLRQFVKDVENARTDAVNKANDSTLAAAYKEMANDAKDLLTAFENMAAEGNQSPEAQAAMA